MQRALGTIPADRTAVIITHRLSTVEIADWVLVLEHSQILENGSPAELEAQGGRYVGLHKPGRSHLPDGTYPRHTLNPGGGIEYRPRHHHVVR